MSANHPPYSYPPPPPILRGTSAEAAGRCVTLFLHGARRLTRPSPRWLAGLVLVAVAALVLLVPAAPNIADAQTTSHSTAILHRTVIEEGKTRRFEISGLPNYPAYYIYFKPLASYTAEESDISTFEVNRSGVAPVPITPGYGARTGKFTGNPLHPKRLRFMITTAKDIDTDDETFGVQLCTTVTCTGGTILGDWTVTITDATDTMLTGTGTTITISGGHTTVMEKSLNNDESRDGADDITITLATAPTVDIVILGKVDTQVQIGGTTENPRMRAIAQPNGPPASGDSTNNDGDWFFVHRFNNMVQDCTPGNPSAATPVPRTCSAPRTPTAAELTGTFEVVSRQNIVDSADLTGTLSFKVVTFADAEEDDRDTTDVQDNPAYTAITLPDVPVTLTGDDERTEIELRAAATPDNSAKEGDMSDTAKFRVTLSRALEAGEWIDVPLASIGAQFGTHFTLSIDGNPMGVTYADAPDGTKGWLRFAGPSAAEATMVVTPVADDGDNVSEKVMIHTYRDSTYVRNNRIPTNLDGGVCAGEGCTIAMFEKRVFRMTIDEAQAGLTIIDSGNQRLLEDDITENVPVIDRRGGYHLEEKTIDGGEYSYDVRLSAAPASDVTIAVSSSDTTKATITTGASLTFTSTNWSMPQTVTVSAADDSDDSSDTPLTITHAITGTGSYASINNITYPLTLVDNDATTVTMTGTGVRTSELGTEISNVMVEGDPTRVDRSLTISLGRTLEAGEYVRVPLYLEADGHTMLDGSGEECDLSRDSTWTDGIENLPDWGGCAIVDSIRGPRYSANVAWPPHHNDFAMAATGTGVTVEAVNRRTPAHAGFRIVEFRGAGARTATIELKARNGFDDGESFDEAFSITFPNNLRYIGTSTVDGHVFRPNKHMNARSNLGGGVTAAAADLAAWYGITDDDSAGVATGEDNVAVPLDWPLLPDGLSIGDTFRLLYVTNGETTATSRDPADYDRFVRKEITGTQLKDGGVPELATHAASFFSLVTTLGTQTDQRSYPTYPARERAEFREDEDTYPDDAIYWVGGNKVADNKTDFTDGTWDSESPRHADGTAATVDTDGYWTGSGEHGHRTGQTPCSGGTSTHNRNQAGEPNVHVGKLDGNDSSRFSPLGPILAQTPACADAEPNSELRPTYALSTAVFEVVGGAEITQRATAAEGSVITFTVTIPTAAPAGASPSPTPSAMGSVSPPTLHTPSQPAARTTPTRRAAS